MSLKEIVLIIGIALAVMMVVATYVLPSASAQSSGSDLSGTIDGKSLVALCVIALTGYIFYKEVYPRFQPDRLEVRTVKRLEGTQLVIKVTNARESAYVLRELTCYPIGGSEDPVGRRVVKVDQTVIPGQHIDLLTDITPSLADYTCKQEVFEVAAQN